MSIYNRKLENCILYEYKTYNTETMQKTTTSGKILSHLFFKIHFIAIDTEKNTPTTPPNDIHAKNIYI